MDLLDSIFAILITVFFGFIFGYSKPGDSVLTILIIGLLGLLIVYSELSVYIMSVDKDWTANRCNPLVMPFISLAGHDATNNFMKCIAAAESQNMEALLQPINDRISGLNNTAASINTSIDNARTDLYGMRTNIYTTFDNVYSVILNILIEVQRSLIWIKEVISKMVGILAALSYSMQGGMFVGKQIIDGPITSLTDEIFNRDAYLTIL